MQRNMVVVLAAVVGVSAGPALAQGQASCSKAVEPNAAIEACSRVIAGGEASAAKRALLVRGDAYKRKGMNREAADDFTAVLKQAPNTPDALLGRGEAYLAERQFDRALADFSALAAAVPGHATALIGLGYAHLAKDEAELAVEAFSRALASDARNGVAFNNRGLAYKKLGNLDLAIRDFTSAVQFHPLYALAYNNRAYAYEAKGEKERAVQDFRNALSIDPSLTGARDGLVRLGASGAFVAEASERVRQGQEVAEKNCAWCHAIGAEGKSPNPEAPAFREIHARHPILALRAPIARAIATPHDRMPKLPLSDSDVDRIIAYINSLDVKRSETAR